MTQAKQAREKIRAAIKAAGGVYAVAERCGVHFTQIYSFLKGGGLTEPNAGRVRAAVPDVPDVVWADAFAPAPTRGHVDTCEAAH